MNSRRRVGSWDTWEICANIDLWTFFLLDTHFTVSDVARNHRLIHRPQNHHQIEPRQKCWPLPGQGVHFLARRSRQSGAVEFQGRPDEDQDTHLGERADQKKFQVCVSFASLVLMNQNLIKNIRFLVSAHRTASKSNRSESSRTITRRSSWKAATRTPAPTADAIASDTQPTNSASTPSPSSNLRSLTLTPMPASDRHPQPPPQSRPSASLTSSTSVISPHQTNTCRQATTTYRQQVTSHKT